MNFRLLLALCLVSLCTGNKSDPKEDASANPSETTKPHTPKIHPHKNPGNTYWSRKYGHHQRSFKKIPKVKPEGSYYSHPAYEYSSLLVRLENDMNDKERKEDALFNFMGRLSHYKYQIASSKMLKRFNRTGTSSVITKALNELLRDDLRLLAEQSPCRFEDFMAISDPHKLDMEILAKATQVSADKSRNEICRGKLRERVNSIAKIRWGEHIPSSHIPDNYEEINRLTVEDKLRYLSSPFVYAILSSEIILLLATAIINGGSPEQILELLRLNLLPYEMPRRSDPKRETGFSGSPMLQELLYKHENINWKMTSLFKNYSKLCNHLMIMDPSAFRSVVKNATHDKISYAKGPFLTQMSEKWRSDHALRRLHATKKKYSRWYFETYYAQSEFLVIGDEEKEAACEKITHRPHYPLWNFKQERYVDSHKAAKMMCADNLDALNITFNTFLADVKANKLINEKDFKELKDIPDIINFIVRDEEYSAYNFYKMLSFADMPTTAAEFLESDFVVLLQNKNFSDAFESKFGYNLYLPNWETITPEYRARFLELSPLVKQKSRMMRTKH